MVLRLLIDGDGSLAKVEVMRDPGHGFGAAGVRAIREFRFRPGRLNGSPLATTVTFVLLTLQAVVVSATKEEPYQNARRWRARR